jgi:uncharacterized DUF497 family protein
VGSIQGSGESGQARHQLFGAQYAFDDPRRIIAEDLAHSTELEKRYFCFGELGDGVLTVRFTYRDEVIRIFGAGYWTRGLRLYEKANKVHK